MREWRIFGAGFCLSLPVVQLYGEAGYPWWSQVLIAGLVSGGVRLAVWAARS